MSCSVDLRVRRPVHGASAARRAILEGTSAAVAVGKVFAHPGTWGKLIRERGWRRPRLRLYPAKPKVGLRTHAPNEAWHIDVTIIKLLDGTKAYVHAVIDNFSRRILAWTVAGRLDPMNTHDVLTRAAGHLVASTNVFMDSGVEHLNGDVDPLFEDSAGASPCQPCASGLCGPLQQCHR